MRNYSAIIYAAAAVAITASSVSGAALVRDLAEASYCEVLDAGQSKAVQSTPAVVENADAIPADLGSGISGSDEVRER